jgi:hypothetical protein
MWPPPKAAATFGFTEQSSEGVTCIFHRGWFFVEGGPGVFPEGVTGVTQDPGNPRGRKTGDWGVSRGASTPLCQNCHTGEAELVLQFKVVKFKKYVKKRKHVSPGGGGDALMDLMDMDSVDAVAGELGAALLSPDDERRLDIDVDVDIVDLQVQELFGRDHDLDAAVAADEDDAALERDEEEARAMDRDIFTKAAKAGKLNVGRLESIVEKLATEGSMDQEDMETDAMLSIMMSMEPAFPAASSTATSSASGASSSSSSSAGAASLVPSRPVPASGGDSQQPNPGQPRPLHIVVDLWHASVTASLDALSSRSPEQPLGGPDHCNMSLVQADDTTYYVHWTGVASRHGRVVRIDPHGRAIYSIPAMVPARSFAHARVLVADIGVRMLKRTAALRCVCVCP